jgi:hypothetical protein
VEQEFELYEEQTEESEYQTSEEEEEEETSVFHEEMDTTQTSVDFTTTATTATSTTTTTDPPATTTAATTTSTSTSTTAGRTYSMRRSRLTTPKLRLFATEENSQLPKAVPSSSLWNPQPTEEDFLGTNSITEEVKPGLEQVKTKEIFQVYL